MRRDAHGSGLWAALLLIVVALVVADFVHHPFIGSSAGDAARPRRGLTLWIARSEAGSPDAVVLSLADGNLGRANRIPTPGELEGGASSALAHFAALPRRRGADLFAVTSTTLAELARDRRDSLLPEAQTRAAHAEDLLARMIPIGLLSEEALRLTADASSGLSASDVASRIGSISSAPIFGIPSDPWIEDQFAALVQGVGTPGRVPYGAYADPENAILALAAGEAEVALLPAASVLAGGHAGTLQTLAWPGTRHAPESWVGLLAPADTPPRTVAALRRRVAALAKEKRWRHLLRRDGARIPKDGSPRSLATRLREEHRQAGYLQGLSAQLQRGG